MKPVNILPVVIIFLLLCIVSFKTNAQDMKLSSSAVGVRELMNQVDKFPGTIRIIGIVSRVFPEDHLIGLIDIKEFDECKVTTCARLILPVQWEGEMPTLQNKVEVVGKVEKKNGRKVFVAESISVIH